MSDPDLIMDKIRHELNKGLPSKRKILSYLLDLLNKDKYPALSDFEFYDIVGQTYTLNLDYKLNLEMLFDPIYDNLKKKIKKLYGDEKRLEMEQYLIKNYGLFSQEQRFDNIKEEFEQVDPSKISAFLSDLDSKKEYQLLSESELLDIIGETFKSNPEFYMENLYEKVRERVKKLYGDEKLKEMEKNLLEKFSLHDGEQILFECGGRIKQLESQELKPSGRIKLGVVPVSLSISSGNIMVTNYRIIAQGKVNVGGGQTPFWGIIDAISGIPALRRDESRKVKIESSIQQELPCYGFQFSIQNHLNLKKIAYGIKYEMLLDNRPTSIKINLPRGTSQVKVEEQINTLFKILSKDANQVFNIIKAQLEREINPTIKRAKLLAILRNLRTNEEYQKISDNGYLDIVKETYKLNPQFFIELIYPKMKSWKFPSFLTIKERFLGMFIEEIV